MKSSVGVLALFVVGLVAIAGAASAFGGFWQDGGEVKAALEAGDYSAWKEAIESQLTEDNFNQMRQMNEQRETMKEYRDAMRQAIEDNDYDAWKEAATAMGVDAEDILSEEDFSLLVQMHEAQQSGDTETASELRSELGNLGPLGMDLGFGMGHGGHSRPMGSTSSAEATE